MQPCTRAARFLYVDRYKTFGYQYLFSRVLAVAVGVAPAPPFAAIIGRSGPLGPRPLVTVNSRKAREPWSRLAPPIAHAKTERTSLRWSFWQAASAWSPNVF